VRPSTPPAPRQARRWARFLRDSSPGSTFTRAAEALFVNPNTVVYRLQRIKELSGRDAHDLGDLLVLYLALKLEQLNPSR
jgi:hypothetical protein